MPEYSGKTIRRRKLKRTSSPWPKFKKKAAKIISLIFISFVAVFISITLLAGFTFYKFITKSFADNGSFEEASLAKKSTFSLALIKVEDLKSENPKILGINYLFFNKDPKNLIVFNVDPHLEYALPGESESVSFSRAFSIGNNLKNGKGREYALERLNQFFANKADAFIFYDSSVEDKLTPFLPDTSSQIPSHASFVNLSKIVSSLSLSDISFKDVLNSNISLYDAAFLISYFRSIYSSDIEQHDISSSLPESLNFIDSKLRGRMEMGDEKLNARIMVFNGTNIPGLGTQTARFVENKGYFVVNIGNYPYKIEKSMLISSDMTSPAVSALSQGLRINTITRKDEANEILDLPGYDADILVIAGVDFIDPL